MLAKKPFKLVEVLLKKTKNYYKAILDHIIKKKLFYFRKNKTKNKIKIQIISSFYYIC